VLRYTEPYSHAGLHSERLFSDHYIWREGRYNQKSDYVGFTYGFKLQLHLLFGVLTVENNMCS
jgi:hypothetical protein